jgi:hypothetical protein
LGFQILEKSSFQNPFNGTENHPPPWGNRRKALKGVFSFENLCLGLKKSKLKYIQKRDF